MSTEETIFAEALAKRSAEEREAYLAAACAADPGLRANIDGLLAAHQQPGGLLDRSVPDAEVTQEDIFAHNQLGTVIGHYKLLEKIGEGGMGEVYMAEQQRPVRRKVALKIIKPGMDSKQVIGRFEAERQALALMDHPNIARVLDGGATENGLPFFVMELVRGVPLTEYCDQNRLTVRQRLDLFVQVCRAVQHAHQKGIIHRDLKPSNVLVTLHDGAPAPKIIDFGIAKAVGEPLTDRTLFTNFSQFVGTPLYMSPEQAGLSNQYDVDTRSDIYSLGVLLYELLTGTTPFDKNRLGKAAYEEIRRIIREEEPPKPSTRLSTLGETLTGISASRQTEPAKLGRLIRGDLDWVVMKSLDKDRSQPYETANAFARDLERYIRDEPVGACPPSTLYRMRKFVRRNRGRVVVAASLSLGLVGMTGLLIYGFIREGHHKAAFIHDLQDEQRKTMAQKSAAKDAQDEAEAVNAFLLKMLSASDPDQFATREPSAKPADLTVRQVLDDAVKEVDRGSLKDHPKVAAAVRMSLGRTYYGMGLYREAEAQHRAALEVRRRIFGELHKDVADSVEALALDLLRLGDLTQSEKYVRDALQIYRDVLGARDPRVAECTGLLGWVLIKTGNLAEAENLIRGALQMQRELLGDQHQDVGQSLKALAGLLHAKGDLEGAERNMREAVQMQRKFEGVRHPGVIQNMNNLALILREEGKTTEAEALYREVLQLERGLYVDRHPILARTLHDLGILVLERGNLVEAEKFLREALQMQQALFGEHNSVARDTLRELAYLLEANGNAAEVEKIHHDELLNPDTLGAQHEEEEILSGFFLGKLAASEDLYRELVQLQRRREGEYGVRTLDAKISLTLIMLRKQPFRSLELLRELNGDLREAVEMRKAHPSAATTRPSDEQAAAKELRWITDELAACETAMAELMEVRAPFSGTPAPVPGLLQAEDFDRGGLGISYWDSTLLSGGTNQPPFRGTSVDLDHCKDDGGGVNVGAIMPGEWLEYTVNVLEEGNYDLSLRIATIGAGAKVHVEFGGQDATGPIILPKTGDWQSWQTATTRPIRLHSGRQVMRVVFDSRPRAGGRAVCNLNWIRLTKSAE